MIYIEMRMEGMKGISKIISVPGLTFVVLGHLAEKKGMYSRGVAMAVREEIGCMNLCIEV